MKKKHIWWGQTSYIAIPGQRCSSLLALISREYTQLVQRTTGTCTCTLYIHTCVYIHVRLCVYIHVMCFNRTLCFMDPALVLSVAPYPTLYMYMYNVHVHANLMYYIGWLYTRQKVVGCVGYTYNVHGLTVFRTTLENKYPDLWSVLIHVYQ